MKAEEFEDLIPDYILGKLTKDQNLAFSEYLNNNPQALQDWSAIHKHFDSVESEPSKKMDATFYAFLEAESKKSSNSRFKHLLTKRIPANASTKIFIPLLAASLVLFFGFLIGRQFSFNPDNSSTIVNTESVDEIKQETNDLRTQLVISLADESSASKRLKALSEATKLDTATEQVILALFKMLNEDTNVNVRLAAVASLSKYVDNPKVREGLVMSITKQDSPLVQIALAELMVTLKEQTSINSMETLLKKPDINSTVKQKLEESIKQII